MTTKMQSCVDHIKTSLDVDPWAMEMVEKIFTEYGRRFDKVLEIIDKDKEEHAKYDRLLNPMWLRGCFDTLDYLREAVLALKGGEQE